MSAVMTVQQAATILRRDDLPASVYWSWFEHETKVLMDTYDMGVEDAARELRDFANRLIRESGGDPEAEVNDARTTPEGR